MRIIVSFIVAAFIVTIAAASCGGGVGGNSPSGITESIYSHLKNGNYEKGVEVLINNFPTGGETDDRTADEKQQFIDGFASKAKETFEKKGGIKSFSVIDETISADGTRATVKISVTYGNGTTVEEKLHFIKENDQWKTRLGE